MGRLTAMSTLKVTDRGAEKHPALFVTDPLNRSPTQTSVLSITMTLSDWNEYDTNNDNKALRARMNAMILRKEILQDLIEVNQITLELSGEPYQRPVDPDFDLRRRCQDIPWVSFRSFILVFHCVAESHS